MQRNGTPRQVSKFRESEMPKLREERVLLPPLFLHKLDSRFMVQEGAVSKELRSGNDNVELFITLPMGCQQQQQGGFLDSIGQKLDELHTRGGNAEEGIQESDFNTVAQFLKSWGEVTVSENRPEPQRPLVASVDSHRLYYRVQASRPKAAISLQPKKQFGIPEDASLYLFVQNHHSVPFMSDEETHAFQIMTEGCMGSEDEDLVAFSIFLKIFFEGGFCYNKKKPTQGGYIPQNVCLCCLGLVEAFEGQSGIGSGYPYEVQAAFVPFADTVPVTIQAISDMGDRHARYGLCFTRCVHVWETEAFDKEGVLDFCSLLPHGGFYYVPRTLQRWTEVGGLIYAFGESKEGDEGAPPIEQPPQQQTVQVCFTMDCTASMGHWIKAAKQHAVEMADTVVRDAAHLAVEMSFVCYRDIEHGDQNIVSRDFTTNIADLKSFIGTLKAKSVPGQSDGPEDMSGGLKKGMELAWKEHAKKFLVVVADQPCHGKPRFHTQSKDNYPEGGPSGLPDPSLEMMRDQGIQLIFVRINHFTDTMVAEFRKIYDKPELSIIEVDLSKKGSEAFNVAITSEVVANLG